MSHFRIALLSMLQIIKTEIQRISDFRTEYLHSLSEFQELYLEMMVEESDYYLLTSNQLDVGYFIKTKSNILVEFYLVDEQIPDCKDVFNSIIRDYSIQSVYCKSFDSLLMDCCLSNSYNYQIIGCLFRDCFKTIDYPLTGLTSRFATMADFDFLLLQEDGLYETTEELKHFVNGGNVIMFMNNNELYGCGYLIKVHPKWDVYDIGMWVNPRFRNRRIATGIISSLKQTCLMNNWKPICGCAYDNVGSKKTLEKNGFVSKYKLVEFEIKEKNVT